VDPKHDKHINKDVQDAVSAGVNSTPTVFVNGRIVTNRTLDGINAMINEEMQKKKKK
jgi:protein-disulfide isomerase